jgi:hypothetical protein
MIRLKNEGSRKGFKCKAEDEKARSIKHNTRWLELSGLPAGRAAFSGAGIAVQRKPAE